ncbi:MAG: hypothetical protein J3K34DRAFT_230704 [Monoraphidium minutum]|nr:MAG: hypothetical protein J3K34DRAFT_230704 [Monoraphidium minutum]
MESNAPPLPRPRRFALQPAPLRPGAAPRSARPASHSCGAPRCAAHCRRAPPAASRIEGPTPARLMAPHSARCLGAQARTPCGPVATALCRPPAMAALDASGGARFQGRPGLEGGRERGKGRSEGCGGSRGARASDVARRGAAPDRASAAPARYVAFRCP